MSMKLCFPSQEHIDSPFPLASSMIAFNIIYFFCNQNIEQLKGTYKMKMIPLFKNICAIE